MNATPRFGLRSFRAKFVLVVGGAVLFDLLVSGGLALWNVNRLSRDATQQVGLGLTKATSEYLHNYIETTAERTDLLIDQVHTEVDVLAGSMQALIDHPGCRRLSATAIESDPSFSTALKYNPRRRLVRRTSRARPRPIRSGAISSMRARNLLPDVATVVRDSTAFDIIGPTVQATGTRKLQVYFLGPKGAPDPSLDALQPDQGITFDKVYPGHNSRTGGTSSFPTSTRIGSPG